MIEQVDVFIDSIKRMSDIAFVTEVASLNRKGMIWMAVKDEVAHQAAMRTLLLLLEDHDKWVPVSENLPHESGMYLVYSESADKNLPFRTAIYFDIEHGWTGLVDPWLKALTHWMPFPAAPVAKEKL